MSHSVYESAMQGAWRPEQIESYLPLVKKIAGRLAISLPPHVDEDDLVGYGVFGLLDAVDRFDAGRGVKFETYATLRIRGAIIDGLRSMDWVPHSARQKVKRIQEAFYKVEALAGRPATIPEVAVELSMTEGELEGALVTAQMLNLSSLDEWVTTDDGETAGSPHDILVDPNAQKGFNEVEHKERKELLAEAIEKLPEKEKLVIGLYYQEELTLKEIAAVLKLSESRISQLHSQAILRLRGRLSRQKKKLF